MRNILYYFLILANLPAYGYLTPTYVNANQIQSINVSATAPTNGQCLVYSSGSGLYAPASCGGGGGGSPGGSDTDVQYNDSGSFGGDAGFTYNKTTHVMSLTGVNLSGLTASKPLFTDSSKNLVSTGTLANSQGGTGGDSSAATGLAKVSSGTWSYATLVNADVSASAAIAYSKLAALTSGNILVGSAGNVATSTAVTGDVTISNAGVTAIGATKVTNAMLNGSIAASKLVGTDIDTLGTVTTGTWSATTIALNKGGTGQTTKAAAFDALSPMSASGDIIYGGASGTGTRLAKGSDGNVLTLASGIPSWAAPSGGIGGSTGATANRMILSSGTGGSTIAASTISGESSGAFFSTGGLYVDSGLVYGISQGAGPALRFDSANSGYSFYGTGTFMGSLQPTGLWLNKIGNASFPSQYGFNILTLSVSDTPVGNVGSGEDTLISYTLPASAMSVNTNVVEIEAGGSFAATVDNKALKLYFGSTAIFDSGTLTAANGGRWKIKASVVRDSASTQTAFVEVTSGNTVLSAISGFPLYKSSPTETLTSAVVIKGTGENVSAANSNAVVQDYMIVSYRGNN